MSPRFLLRWAPVAVVGVALSGAPLMAQDPAPMPSVSFQPRPVNALVGTSGPEWDIHEGVGRYSGVAYERTLFSRLILRADFGQSYNGDGAQRFREFVDRGIRIRETFVTDFGRLVLGGQIGLVQQLGGARVLLFAGPAFTRVSRSDRVFLTDLRFGDSVETDRRTTSDNATGMLYGGGVEADIAQGFAYRLMVVHNRAGENATALALGGAYKF